MSSATNARLLDCQLSAMSTSLTVAGAASPPPRRRPQVSVALDFRTGCLSLLRQALSPRAQTPNNPSPFRGLERRCRCRLCRKSVRKAPWSGDRGPGKLVGVHEYKAETRHYDKGLSRRRDTGGRRLGRIVGGRAYRSGLGIDQTMPGLEPNGNG